MKKSNLFKIFFIFLLLPVQLFAQENEMDNVDISGLWKGILYNDTTQKTLRYELAISDENGKLSAYSYTIFTIEGIEEVGVKRLKIKRKKDKIFIEDIELIANNYSGAPPKGVHQRSELTLSRRDTSLILSGLWSTNRTIQYRPLTGTLMVQRKSPIVEKDIAKKVDEWKKKDDLSTTQYITPKAAAHVAELEKKVEATSTTAAVQSKPAAPKVVAEQPKVKPTAVVAAKPKPIVKAVAPPASVIVPAVDAAKRKMGQIETVYYKSDSLTLTLYDNGEVDGDTVSVLMNGVLIYSKERLSTKANTKTIHITKDTPDSLFLVMYAENLGSIPPNTGLLVVHDGESTYEVRFSADLNTNSGIILRRRKEQQ